ncbi:MAG: hypothetical protein FJ276_32265 [Planctomycetes bacterium]|nr:hypothetical protein [Planctomycetota bacterium]
MVKAASVCLMLLAAASVGRSNDGNGALPSGLLADGQSFSAKLVEVTGDGQFVFERAGTRLNVDRRDLVLWGTYADRDRDCQLVFADGGMLVADVLAIEPDAVVVAGRRWADARIPPGLVRGIVFRPPADPLVRDMLYFRVLDELREEDRLVLENGDELAGRMPTPVRPEPGGFHPTSFQWPVRGRSELMTVPVERVVAVLFASDKRAAARAPEPATLVGLRDGSRLYVRRIERKENVLELELTNGHRLATAPTSTADPWGAVTLLQPLDDRVVYLSDLEPLAYQHTAFLAVDWPYRRDRSVSGGRLRHLGHVATKGLGMHSSSRLAYDLPGRFRALHAELAIDQRAGSQGSVTYRVFLQDPSGEWKKAFESEPVRGAQPAVPVRVELSDAVRVALIVDFADRADQWDHANWLNARLIPYGPEP